MSAADKKDEHDHSPWQEREQVSRAWGILLFGLIAATATTFAVPSTLPSINSISNIDFWLCFCSLGIFFT